VKNLSITITSGSFVKAILLVLLVALLYYLRDIVMIVLTAIVIASSVEPGIQALIRRKLSRLFSVIIVYLTIASVFLGILFLFVPPVLGDTAGFLNGLPEQLSAINISEATFGLLRSGAWATRFRLRTF
jgi:predicted PurR-regulated permease PerM